MAPDRPYHIQRPQPRPSVKPVILKPAPEKRDDDYEPKMTGRDCIGSSPAPSRRKARIERKRLKKHRKGR